MHIQLVKNSKSEYRNAKQIQNSNVQMIEEPRSKLLGKRYGECARYDGSNIVFERVSPRSCFDHSNLDH
jgi:hypothetical protein